MEARGGAGAPPPGAGAPPPGPSAGRKRTRPGEIKNKIKRAQVHAKQQHEKKREQAEARRKRQRAAAELGSDAPPKQVPRTLDNTREVDDTVVAPGDEEVLRDEAEDEFAPYFSGARTPKLMITTKVNPSAKIYELISEMLNVFPNSFYYKRKQYPLKKIQVWAANKGFTHLLVLSERLKQPNGCVARGWVVGGGCRVGAARAWRHAAPPQRAPRVRSRGRAAPSPPPPRLTRNVAPPRPLLAPRAAWWWCTCPTAPAPPSRCRPPSTWGTSRGTGWPRGTRPS